MDPAYRDRSVVANYGQDTSIRLPVSWSAIWTGVLAVIAVGLVLAAIIGQLSDPTVLTLPGG